MKTFFILTVVVIVIIISLSFIKLKSKNTPRNVLNDLEKNPEFKEVAGLLKEYSKMYENGTDKDIIPGGYGEFGHEASNPIPVHTVKGSESYLSNLRTLNGEMIQYQRICSVGSANIGKPIDLYEITVNGEDIGKLYICPYHKINSRKSPDGFILIS